MAGNVPWNNKKHLRRVDAEANLFSLLNSDVPLIDLKTAAEGVRQAKLRELASKRLRLPPCEKSGEKLAPIDRATAIWRTMTAEQVIEIYRRPLRQRPVYCRGT